MQDSNRPKFPVGSVVHVRWEVADFDYPDIPFGGWVGRVIEVQEDACTTCLVRWTPETLAAVSLLVKHRYDCTETWLDEDDLEPDDGKQASLPQLMGDKPPSPDRSWPNLKARNTMQAQTVRIDLRYDRVELKQILRYAKAHDLERNGRYDFRKPPRLNIWTHTWSNAGCKAESCLMFSLEFDCKTASLMSVMLLPGFGWEAFLDELARLERTGLGYPVYGKRRREPTT